MPKDNPENYDRTIEKSILETMREPLIVLDADLKVISANKSFYRNFKVNPKETVGQLIYDLGNRQWNIPALRKLLEKILPNNTSFENYEVEHDFPKIGKRTMLLNSRRIPRPPAKPKIILLAIEDITERKRLENELLLTKEKEFRAIFDNAADGILLADMKSKKFIRGNNAICRMLGYSGKEIRILGVMDIHPKKDIPYIIDQFKRQAKGEFTMSRDLPIKRKDGSVFYADINSAVITISKKRYMVGFFHDTTERKNAEEKLKKSKKELEVKISDFGRFNKLSVGRELRMMELKKKIKKMEDLLRKHGIEPGKVDDKKDRKDADNEPSIEGGEINGK